MDWILGDSGLLSATQILLNFLLRYSFSFSPLRRSVICLSRSARAAGVRGWHYAYSKNSDVPSSFWYLSRFTLGSSSGMGWGEVEPASLTSWICRKDQYFGLIFLKDPTLYSCWISMGLLLIGSRWWVGRTHNLKGTGACVFRQWLFLHERIQLQLVYFSKGTFTADRKAVGGFPLLVTFRVTILDVHRFIMNTMKNVLKKIQDYFCFLIILIKIYKRHFRN